MQTEGATVQNDINISMSPKSGSTIKKDAIVELKASSTQDVNISRVSYTITDESGNRLDASSKVGTGCKVTDHNGNAYTVIVKGDVDGNGNVDTTDYLKIKSAFLGALDLNETYFKAADVDGSSNIDTTDYLKIKNHFLGTCNLYS